MLQIDAWTRGLSFLVVIAGLVLALPNLFYGRVESQNDAAALIEAQGATPEREADLALWPSWMPSSLVNLGLDLRGGAHLLAEVQVADVYADRMDGLWPAVRDRLRDERDTVGTIRRQPSADDELRVRISQPEAMDAALAAVRELAQPIVTFSGVGQTDIVVSGDGDEIIVRLSEEEQRLTDDRTIQQSLEIIRRRVDEVGTRDVQMTLEASVAPLEDIAARARQAAIERGFTGDICDECGSSQMTRNGTCLKCNSCGSTTGCS